MSLPDPDSSDRDLVVFMLLGFGSLVLASLDVGFQIPNAPIEGALDFFLVFGFSWAAYKLGKGRG